MSKNGSDLRGFIKISNENFTITTIQGKHILSKVSESNIIGNDCSSRFSPSNDQNFDFISETYPYCPIDILVLYDPTLDYTSGSINANTLEDFELETELNSSVMRTSLNRSDLGKIRFNIIDVQASPVGITPSSDPILYAANLATDPTLITLKKDLDAAVIFISHDLAVIAEIADRVLVMYKGEIVEQGKVADIFQNPQHPYTKGTSFDG